MVQVQNVARMWNRSRGTNLRRAVSEQETPSRFTCSAKNVEKQIFNITYLKKKKKSSAAFFFAVESDRLSVYGNIKWMR